MFLAREDWETIEAREAERPERVDYWYKRADFGLKRVDFGPKKAYFGSEPVAQVQYVVRDTRCPALHDQEFE